MDTICWQIYDFIKENTLNGDWVKQEDIQKYLLDKKGVEINKRNIRKKIKEIRECDTIQKIILSDYGKGYRLMSSEEELDYLEKRKISILCMLGRYYKDIERYNTNNQLKITLTKNERNIFESLIGILETKGGK